MTHTTSERFKLTVDGTELSLLRSANGKYPVLFCHSNSTSSDNFLPCFEQLASRYDCVALDFPGHGLSARSGSPEATYSMPGLAGVVRSVIAQLGWKRYALVGHSLGGHSACQAAPELSGLRGLMLVSAPPIRVTELGRIYREDPTAGALFSGELTSDQVQRFARALVSPETVPAEQVRELETTIRRTDPQFRAWLGKNVAAGRFADEVTILSQLDSPTALVYGLDDAFIHPEYYRTVTLKRPWRSVSDAQHTRAGLVPLQGAGHSPNLTGNAAFLGKLAEFLESCAATA